MHIRSITVNDAERFLQLCLQLDQETQFMLLEVGERRSTVEEQRLRIEQLLARSNHMLFIAEHDGRLVGYLEAEGGNFKRNRDNVYIVVGLLQAYRGQGLGTRLFLALEDWACQQSIHRLELTVMTANAAAIALYTRRGFVIEGQRKEALFVDGRYVDEYSMAKLLPVRGSDTSL